MNEARDALNRAMSERALQGAVIETAQRLGYRVAHFRPARTERGWRTPVEADGAGFVDLVLVRPGVLGEPAVRRGVPRLLFVELKRQDGEVSKLQADWLAALATVAETYCWRPCDLDAIAEILA